MKKVSDILYVKRGEKIVSVDSDCTVLNALAVLSSGNFGVLPVKKDGSLVGIFSERDYARKGELKGKDAQSTLVSESMTPNPICVSPEDTLEKCMNFMNDKGFRHLPVLEGSNLVGMISIKDAIRAVLSDKDALLEAMISMDAHKQESRDRELTTLLKHLKGSVNLVSHPDISKTIDDALMLTQKRQKLMSAKVLLATEDSGEEMIAKMALSGTGVELHTTSDLNAGKALVGKNTYDIVCVNQEMIPLAKLATERNPDTRAVFMTADNPDKYVHTLKYHPYLSNVVSQSREDRQMSVRSMLSTVSKIIHSDFFGIEKYLNWGANIKESKFTQSTQRDELVLNLTQTCQALGIRRTLINRCTNVAEELLMNALYDAPTDLSGRQLYNHLPRTTPISLSNDQACSIRYGSDGTLFGISVQDPFGSLERDTVLEYFASCTEGKENPLHKNKGGGGHGLYIIMSSGNQIIFNVKKRVATEVIVLFDLAPIEEHKLRKASFHFFHV